MNVPWGLIPVIRTVQTMSDTSLVLAMLATGWTAMDAHAMV